MKLKDTNKGNGARVLLSIFFTAVSLFLPLNLNGQIAGLPAPSSQSDSYQQVKQFLQNFPIIRVPIVGAKGNGHQAAGVTLIENLRQIGYRGHIQIIYDKNDTAEKLIYLLPPYRGPQLGEYQKIESLNLSVISKRQLEQDATLGELPLAIGAADQWQGGNKSLKVRGILNLQPFHWTLERNFIEIGDDRIALDDLKDLGFTANSERVENVSEFLNQQLGHNINLKKKIPVLEALLDAPHGRPIMPVYSHDLRNKDGGYQIFTIIQAMEKLVQAEPTALKKGAVVVILNELPPHILDYYHSELKTKAGYGRLQVRFVDYEEARVEDYILRPLANEITVLSLGRTPKKVFEYLYSRANLPAVVEGVNSINYMAATGRPYIPSSFAEGFHFQMRKGDRRTMPLEDVSTFFGEAFSKEELGYLQILNDSLNELVSGTAPKALAKLYLISLQNPKALESLFQKLKIRPDFANDKLAMGVRRFQEVLRIQHYEKMFNQKIHAVSCVRAIAR